MFTRDRFQMVPIQKSCWIGLLFTWDLLTVPSIRSRSGPKTGPPKKQVQFLEPFRSQTDLSPCEHPDRFLLADPSPCKHLYRFLLVLRRHFESYNVYSAHAQLVETAAFLTSIQYRTITDRSHVDRH